MNNKEVAHLWAHKSRQQATGSHFFFQGDTIYSYGRHFPIARHYKGCVLFTTRDYSNTTSRHKSIVRSACTHMRVFHVENPSLAVSGAAVTDYGKRIKAAALRVARATSQAAWHLEGVQELVKEANEFCEVFRFKTRFEVPDLDELKAKAKRTAEQEKRQREAKRKAFEKECEVAVAEWKAGQRNQLPMGLETVYLRRMEGQMQTSRGAVVPITEAERAFRFAMIQRERGWRRNGEQFAVGPYQLDAVNEFGVIAGCHRVAWAEIERFAKEQGWMS